MKIRKPYIALDTKTYIAPCLQELGICKKMGYEYYCKEHFVVKSKTRYSCASAIYFNLGPGIIKDNCEFDIYFNRTNIKPAVFDSRHQIILANWPSCKKIMCTYNNNILIGIPSHPYVLLNRRILCNCNVEAESNFLLESLAACGDSETDMVMYFTVNLAFVDYFGNLLKTLDISVLRNWKTQEHILPIHLETFEINSSLLNAPKILKDFVFQFQHRKQLQDLQEHIDEGKRQAKLSVQFFSQ